MDFHITPKTKVTELLDTFPLIEDYLIELVPAFIKLKNPILRNTIGKLATLEQAAKVGGIELPFLINSLNQKLGLVTAYQNSSENSDYTAWTVDSTKVVNTLDADEIIQNGGKPVSMVLNGLNKLNADEIFQLKCSFFPSPLIDKAKDAGYIYSEIQNPDLSYSIYFRRKQVG